MQSTKLISLLESDKTNLDINYPLMLVPPLLTQPLIDVESWTGLPTWLLLSYHHKSQWDSSSIKTPQQVPFLFIKKLQRLQLNMVISSESQSVYSISEHHFVIEVITSGIDDKTELSKPFPFAMMTVKVCEPMVHQDHVAFQSFIYLFPEPKKQRP